MGALILLLALVAHMIWLWNWTGKEARKQVDEYWAQYRRERR